ncbi:MAG TPA: hypothetical protein VK691_04255 [Solirubrobacteraceae bacterium]|nr:hypothetical protein [Solirubrobacteraceae bacterium]
MFCGIGAHFDDQRSTQADSILLLAGDFDLALHRAIQSIYAVRRPQLRTRMTRITRAWGALAPEQRIATVSALALLVTMFLPWYDLQSLDRKSDAIYSHSISAFGDVSFVEAAVFLVAAGVVALMFARAERRDFHMPGSDGAVVMAAGAWAALLIFYRVFSRPDGHGYPVGIEWGFFLAFVAAGTLGYAGWRMRAANTPEMPLMRPRGSRRRTSSDEDITAVTPSPRRTSRARPVAMRPSPPPAEDSPPPTRDSDPSRDITTVVEHDSHPSEDITTVVEHDSDPSEDITTVVEQSPRAPRSTNPSPTSRRPTAPPKRPRFPPGPSEQLSFDDSPAEPEEH